ncbi:MAG: polysaccharide biosynthesis protein [Eubacterium sp.]|nr:polysaccharide biosynthesis protein [Eubacterium sp.]
MSKFVKCLWDEKIWIRRIALILFDMVTIFLAGAMALLTRFEFVRSAIPKEFIQTYLWSLPMYLVCTFLVFWIFRLYHSLWRYASQREAVNILGACFCALGIEFLFVRVIGGYLPMSFYPLSFMYATFGIVCIRFFYRYIRNNHRKERSKRKIKRVMVIGAGAMGTIIIREMMNSEYLHCKVKCIIDDDKNKKNCFIYGIRVIGGRDKILWAVDKYRIDQIVIAMPSQSNKVIRDILEICKETDCELKTMPGMYQLMNDEVQVKNLRDVDINDLLGRDAIIINDVSINEYISGKTVMVTGGGGSIGSELCRQIASRGPQRLIIVDIYENNAYDIQQELLFKYPRLDLVVLIASVRDMKRINDIFETYRPDIVYHAAAHKHVPLMENSPDEAIKNNVLGTLHVVWAANKWKVSRFVLISTDKAVNPTNVMGASKRICEMIIQAYNRNSKTEYVAVRFGNVLGSNGSVIPLFRKQIASGGPVTVTHPDIIRYFMTIPEAVSLVLQTGVYAKGGEIFVLDMGEPVKIYDLAKNLIRLSGMKVGEDIEIVFTGLRPGEKLYEELLMDEEGMKDTENKLIHIGRPIDFDEEQFHKDMEELAEAAESESKDIRRIIQKIVPTYRVKE